MTTTGTLTGETADDLPEVERFEIRSRGTMVVTVPLFNRAAMRGRTVTVGGQRVRVTGVEDCLVPGHGEGWCPRATGLLVELL